MSRAARDLWPVLGVVETSGKLLAVRPYESPLWVLNMLQVEEDLRPQAAGAVGDDVSMSPEGADDQPDLSLLFTSTNTEVQVLIVRLLTAKGHCHCVVTCRAAQAADALFWRVAASLPVLCCHAAQPLACFA